VWGWNGPGPMLIENNRLEGSGENVMFGGADPRIPGVQPADITIRHNHIIKPLAWKGRWLAKNLVEFKSGVRVLMEGNVFENSWVDGQAGFAAVWWSTDQYGSAPWVMTCDITFRNNRIDNVAGGILLTDGDRANAAMTRVAIRDNLFVGVGAAGLGAAGPLYQLDKPVSHIWIEHNTGFSPLSSVYFVGAPLAGGIPGLVVRDNILGDGSYNVFAKCVQFKGTAKATVDLSFDPSKQTVFGSLNVEEVTLEDVNPLFNALVTAFVRQTINAQVNPFEVLRVSQLALSVPIKTTGGSLKAVVKDVRSEVQEGSLRLVLTYDFSAQKNSG